MTLLRLACCILLLLSGIAIAADEPVAATVPDTPTNSAGWPIMESMTWLEGTWTGDGFETIYSSPKGGVIVSVSKFYDDGICVLYEFERWDIADGQVRMTPYPGGKESVSFTLVDFDPSIKRARFENPAHDWPTSLSYERVSETGLLIELAGPDDEGGVHEERFELTLAE